MTTPRAFELALLREDLAYHQTRVLILVDAVAQTPRNAKKLDGLTKLAKLDFLLRYPALAPKVLTDLDPDDRRLHLPIDATDRLTEVESPMVRYKYGPWDDRYYPVIGALVSRGLLRYTKGRRGNVALTPTLAGRQFARDLAASEDWADICDRSIAIAEASAGLTGNALKELIYLRLSDLMDRPQREVIR